MPKRIDYTPYDIEQMSSREVRKVYSELRKVAYMRQKRLKEAFPESALAGTGKYWRFPMTKNLSDAGVASALADVSFFLKNPLTTVREQRKQLEDLAEDFEDRFKIDIPKDQIPAFFDFMDELRARYGAKLVDSARVASLFDIMQRKNISQENVLKNFSYFLENRLDIDELEIPERKRKYTARDFQKKGIDPEAELNRRKPKKQPTRTYTRSYKRKR